MLRLIILSTLFILSVSISYGQKEIQVQKKQAQAKCFVSPPKSNTKTVPKKKAKSESSEIRENETGSVQEKSGLDTEQKKRHNKNVTKIKVEDYTGDLENLPNGAFLKKESSYNVKTQVRSTQTYVILPKQSTKRASDRMK